MIKVVIVAMLVVIIGKIGAITRDFIVILLKSGVIVAKIVVILLKSVELTIDNSLFAPASLYFSFFTKKMTS